MEEEEKKSNRMTVTERMQNKYPDIDFSDDEALMGKINEDYDNYDNELAGYKDREGKFADMFTSDPRSARLMMDWKEGVDPAVNLIRLYGNDILEAVDDPAKQEEIAAANKEYMDRLGEEREYEKQYSANLGESLSTIERIQQEKGLDDDQIDKAMELIVSISRDAMLGKFTPETIGMALKALNYDNDVELADAEGEVRGRNAKIEEKLRKPKRGDGTAQLDGANGAGGGRQMPDLGVLNNYGDNMGDIWSRGGEKRVKGK